MYLTLNSKTLKKKKITHSCQINEEKHVKSARHLSEKFLNTYGLDDLAEHANNHLIKIFLHFLKYKVEKINLNKYLNNDNSVCLEFIVLPKYQNKVNKKTKIKSKLTNTFSLDNFFLENFKFIII